MSLRSPTARDTSYSRSCSSEGVGEEEEEMRGERREGKGTGEGTGEGEGEGVERVERQRDVGTHTNKACQEDRCKGNVWRQARRHCGVWVLGAGSPSAPDMPLKWGSAALPGQQ